MLCLAGSLPPSLSCVVCMSEFQTREKIRTLRPCRHDFHQKCIDRWLKVSTFSIFSPLLSLFLSPPSLPQNPPSLYIPFRVYSWKYSYCVYIYKCVKGMFRCTCTKAITVVMMLGELVCKTKGLLLCGDYLFYFFPSGAQHMSDM